MSVDAVPLAGKTGTIAPLDFIHVNDNITVLNSCSFYPLFEYLSCEIVSNKHIYGTYFTTGLWCFPTGDDSGMPTEPEKMTNKTSSVYDYVTPEVMSTVVGAALGDQDCLRYSACKAGNYVADVTGKEIVLM